MRLHDSYDLGRYLFPSQKYFSTNHLLA